MPIPQPSRTYQIHLVCGGTGAGKTTYAAALAERIGGIRFSIDDWMAELFWMDSPQPMQFDWIGRCEARIFALAREIAHCGVPAILDLGFATVAKRAEFAALARDAGLSVRLHHVDVASAERWRRVAARNAEKGVTHRLDVPREMFDFMQGLWEPPSEAEMEALDGIRVADGAS